MDHWKYFGITHRNHLVCNPMSSEKLNELVELFALKPGARVLDIACGKAELLLRIAERYDAFGVGVDLSPYEVAEASRRAGSRGLAERVEIVHADGAAYEAPPSSFDLAMCIGATWVWGGYRGTIDALTHLAVPGGLVAIGEPFKLREPSPEYAAAEPGLVSTLVTHADNVQVGVEAGLTPLYTVVSSQDDWDRYEGLQWLAAENYAIEHPDDPDLPALLERARHQRDLYLRHQRDTLSWAIYLFRGP